MFGMKILQGREEISKFLRLLRRRAGEGGSDVERTVAAILGDVKKRGDHALLGYTSKFDGHRLSLRMDRQEIRHFAATADRRVVGALRLSAERIRAFHVRQREKSWTFRQGGAVLGQIIRPLERVGVYVPGGKASYPSTVLMNVIPAQVAGVPEIALCVPAPGGETNPAVMAAIDLLGVKEVYRVGGAQAVAALAFGTESVRKVHKIVGPGNIYVATAKKMVFGAVDIDMIAGPSEILIIADRTAPAPFVAADMLSQAEHDEMASSILISDSADLLESVRRELAARLRTLKRRETARKSLTRFGALIRTPTIRDAVETANEIAPEHLEVLTENPAETARLVRNSGAIFLGPWTPEPLGDYSAGPNHTLPTGGTSRFSSPLGVYDFVKRTSYIEFSRKGFLDLADTVECLADEEGLEAHAETVRVRRAYLTGRLRNRPNR